MYSLFPDLLRKKLSENNLELWEHFTSTKIICRCMFLVPIKFIVIRIQGNICKYWDKLGNTKTYVLFNSIVWLIKCVQIKKGEFHIMLSMDLTFISIAVKRPNMGPFKRWIWKFLVFLLLVLGIISGAATIKYRSITETYSPEII